MNKSYFIVVGYRNMAHKNGVVKFGVTKNVESYIAQNRRREGSFKAVRIFRVYPNGNSMRDLELYRNQTFELLHLAIEHFAETPEMESIGYGKFKYDASDEEKVNTYYLADWAMDCISDAYRDLDHMSPFGNVFNDSIFL